MTNYLNTSKNNQDFSSSEENFSHSSTDILRATVVEESQQASLDMEWAQYFTETVRYIRQSLNREDILETATEEVRRVLGCNRVVVYGLDKESNGVVIAESVAPGFMKAFGMTIKDPCFEARYIDKYQNGRVKATPNIYEANLSACYIEQLEKLAVKANLVAPVINEGKLLGLLVAHQCSQPRHWQEHEIRWFSQIAMQVGFTVDNANVLAEANSLRERANAEAEWTNYFTDAVRVIRKSLSREEIFQTSVKEVRRILGCDRVVIYSLDANSQGVVTAESVSPRFTKALGVTIKDPCFEARYIEKYQNGRVKATANIYEANYSSCYIEQLENLEVKANLVAPIINEDKLLGLLVAHQCSQSRDWQGYEIRCFSQIAMQVGFALDNADVLAQTSDLREQTDIEAEWTQYFTNTVQLIRQSLNREDILKTVTQEVRRVLNGDRVVVYSLNESSRGVVSAESVSPRFTKALGVTIKDPCFEARYIEKYQNGRVKATANIYEANYTSCYIEQLEKLEVKANLVAPIINEGKLLGLLVAHQCSQPRHWLSHEVRWFSQIAMQVGFALDNANVLVEKSNLRQQADTGNEWTQHFIETVRYIRQSLNKEDILEVATEEIRRVMNSERVVVYGLSEESNGVVIAESVSPGFTKALGVTIKDPCFEARYIEKYQNGRVKATANIYEANFTSCYIEQLEKLQVKANLVAPIINEGKLLGLLVAHHCSQPHNWQEHEIKWFSQIAMQVGFALDNAKVLAEAGNLRKQADTETQWTQYFIETVKLIRQSLVRENILETATEEIRRVLDCDRAVVYSLNESSRGVVTAESVSPRFTKALGVTIKDPCFEARYIEKYQNGRVKATANIYEANFTSCYIEQLEKLEVKANLVAPIINEGKLLGLLVAHQCSQPRHWQEHEIRWFSQIAMQIGFALDNAKIIEQNTQTNELNQNQNQNQNQNIFLPQQEDLRQVVIELSQNNQMIFKAFWNKAANLSNYLGACRKQIQQMFDTAKVMTKTASQAEQQVQKNYDLLEEERGNIKSTLESISALEEAVSDGGVKVKQLNQRCQNLSNLINQLAAHLGKQTNNSYSMNGRFAESNLVNGYGETIIVHTDDVHKLKEQLLEVIVETQPLLTSEMAEINQIVEIMEARTQEISTWAKSLQTNEQKLDCIATVNMQVGKLVGDINQTAAIQTQTSQEAEQNMVLAEQVVEHILEKLQFFTKWFTQLTTFAQNSTQKIIFWEYLKGFLASFQRLITSFTQNK